MARRKIDITKNFIRMRQFPPGRCDTESFRTINLGKNKKGILCCPEGEFNRTLKKCRVGTEIQSILKKRR